MRLYITFQFYREIIIVGKNWLSWTSVDQASKM